MNKTLLSSLTEFSSLDDSDIIFGKSASAGAYGFFPASLLSGNGYACRRWALDSTTPIGEACGSIEYLRNLPSLLGLGCYLVDDSHNRKKLDPTNHYKLATGETALLDGSMGQYMWGWRTPFYLAWWVSGSYYYLAASLKPIPGQYNYYIPVASKSAFNAGVMDRDNLVLCSLISEDEQYRGGNGSELSSDDYTASEEILSQLGYPATYLGTSTFETYGAARGDGWGAGWYWIETVTACLFYLIMGTRHCQTSYNEDLDSDGLYQGGLGAGVTSMNSWSAFNGYYPLIPTSAAVSMADGLGLVSYPIYDADGSAVYTPSIPVFFGLKNPYGHLYVGKNRIVGVKNSDASYSFYVAQSSLDTWDYTATSNMLHVGDLAAADAAGWEYITDLNLYGLAGIPSGVGGTSSTYYADGCYRDMSTSGSRAPLGVGYAHNGSYAGLAYFSGSSAPSTANANLSSPHYLSGAGLGLREGSAGGTASAHAGKYTAKRVLVGTRRRRSRAEKQTHSDT